MQDGFDRLGYRSVNASLDMGSGKPLPTHGEGRRCRECGAYLSSYNAGGFCQGACIPPDRRRVPSQMVVMNDSSEPANQVE